MTAQGSQANRYRRAISARSILLAELALAEMEHVQLEDALQLVCLYGEAGDPRYPAAARKYLARWIVEERPSPEDVAATACSFVKDDRAALPRWPFGTCLVLLNACWRSTLPGGPGRAREVSAGLRG